MAAFTSAAVSNKTTSGCTVTFNAAAVDLNAAQIRQLKQLFNQLAVECAHNEGGNSSATITKGSLG